MNGSAYNCAIGPDGTLYVNVVEEYRDDSGYNPEYKFCLYALGGEDKIVDEDDNEDSDHTNFIPSVSSLSVTMVFVLCPVIIWAQRRRMS